MKQGVEEVVEVLKDGGLVVMPSDTIYGIFCDAHNPEAIERLYAARKREEGKACIVLIHSLDELEDFHITLSRRHREFLGSLPDTQASTFIVRSQSDQFAHIHRNLGTIAFRVPRIHSHDRCRGKRLREILKQTGPLLAPSANLAGKDPAQTIEQAKEYFGKTVDVYRDYGKPLQASASSIYDLTNGKPKQIR